MAAVSIGTGYLDYGGAIVTTSGGNIYAIFPYYSGPDLYIYKSTNNGANWSLAWSGNQTALGFSIGYGIRAAIDGNDYIHLLYPSSTSSKNLNYNRFDTSNDTLVGAWENVTGASASTFKCSIAIDSANKPHVCWSQTFILKYSNKVSGSWLATPETLASNANSWSYDSDIIAHGDASDVQVLYSVAGTTTEKPAYIHRSSGGWGSATEFTHSGGTVGKSGLVFDGTNYHYIWHCSYDYYNYFDDSAVALVSSVYASEDSSRGVTGALLGAKVYVPYPPSGESYWKVKIYNTSTSQWSGPFTLSWSMTGGSLKDRNIYEYSHNHEHQSGRINVIYAQGDTVYYDYLIDYSSVSGSKSAYIRGLSTGSSSKSANVQSGTMPRSSKSCYIFAVGEDLVPDSDIANQTGWQNEASGSTLYASLADSSDSTYVWKQPAAANDYFEVSLSNLQYGALSTAGHLIIWRVENLSGQTVVVKIELRKGTSTVIASDQQTLTGSVIEYIKKLTQSEVNNIGGDYSDLRLRCSVVSVT